MHLCKSVARDWRLFARVNTISPGFFDTAMGAAPEVADTVHRYSVLGRQGDPKELAGAFLVRPLSSRSRLPCEQAARLTPRLLSSLAVPRLGRLDLHYRASSPLRRPCAFPEALAQLCGSTRVHTDALSLSHTGSRHARRRRLHPILNGSERRSKARSSGCRGGRLGLQSR